MSRAVMRRKYQTYGYPVKNTETAALNCMGSKLLHLLANCDLERAGEEHERKRVTGGLRALMG